MVSSKSLMVLGLVLAFALVISMEVSARDLAEKEVETDGSRGTYGHGHGGYAHGGGYGHGHGGYGHGHGHCHYPHCKHA